MSDLYKLRDREAQATLDRVARDRDRAPATLKPVLAAFHERLFDPDLQLGTLWKRLGIRDHNISAQFCRAFDAKPWAYVLDARLEVAARLLESTRLKPFQVGMAVGFGSYNNFSRSFTRWSDGLRPMDYRLRRLERPFSKANRDPLREADRALASGDTAKALSVLERAGERHDPGAVEARRGLAYHCRGVDRTLEGDVDRAFDDLRRAERSYAAAGKLPPRVVRHRDRLVLPASTDEALLAALCGECRPALLGDVEMRGHLHRSLERVPRDLRWFERSCDSCYRVVWDALSRARLGLVDDAWRAWWISEEADPGDPATPHSLGRYVASLVRVEKGTFGDQKERKRYADLAVNDALEMRRPLLEAQARIWRASVLRTMAETAAARDELELAAYRCGKSPWLAALWNRMAGILEAQSQNHSKAADCFRLAIERYEGLDPHVSGLLLIQRGNHEFYLGEYEKCMALNQEALAFLDSRRNPLPANNGVPVHLAMCLACLGRWDDAEEALSRCRYDRKAYRGRAAAEFFTRACLRLGREKAADALELFAESRSLFVSLHRPLDVALVDSYSVEAHALRGDRAAARECCDRALRFFETVPDSQETLVALVKLRGFLEQEEVAADIVRKSVRSLARRHGGWLPELR